MPWDHLLQSLTVELATQGDLKLCERPETYTLAPKEQVNMRVNIKVSSTDTGVIRMRKVLETRKKILPLTLGGHSNLPALSEAQFETPNGRG